MHCRALCTHPGKPDCGFRQPLTHNSEHSVKPESLANVATYGGSGTMMYFGLTPGEWQIVGVLGGLLIGVLGLVVNAYFQWKRLELDQGRK
jgi:hypothetical protein